MTEAEEHIVKVFQTNGGQSGPEGRIFTIEKLENHNFETITAQTPIQFNGPSKNGKSKHWTPEDLFISAAITCLQATFVPIAENSNLSYKSIEVTAKGIILIENDKKHFSEIIENVKIAITNKNQIKKAELIVKMAKDRCIIANSLKTKITLNIDVSVIN